MTKRRISLATGLIAIAFPGAALVAQQRGAPPQRGSPPGQDTPYILVTAFHAPDKKLAVEAADELRDRLKSEHSAKELFVITKTSVEGTLQASGYPVDSALSTSDLMELARSMRGEYTTDAWIRKTGTGNAVRVNARILLRQGQQILAQPLPAVEAKDPGDAAKQLDKAISEALKQVPAFKECTNSWRAQKFEEAATKARVGIAAYPNAAWSRVCLLLAYAATKNTPPDSVISVATNVLSTDSTSVTALANLADAYSAKGDTIKMVETMLRMYRLDPSNRKILDQILPVLAKAAPDRAIPILDDLLKDNPGDLEFLDNKWKLEGLAKRYKDAMATGDLIVKTDTGRATLDWFNRQIGAAQNDSNATKVIEYATRAAQKFPKDASFAMLVSQGHRKAGQLQQAAEYARRATDADPKDARTWMNSIAIAMDMKQPDTLLNLVKAAAAAGADKAQLEQVLLTTVIRPAYNKANESKERADWEALLGAATAMDGAMPAGASKFYLGLSKFQVGVDALQTANKLGEEASKAKPAAAGDLRAKACTEVKMVEEYWADATIAMTSGGGGAYNKEGATGVMSAIQQYNQYIPELKKRNCLPAKP